MRFKKSKNPLFTRGVIFFLIFVFLFIAAFTSLSDGIKNAVFVSSSNSQAFLFQKGGSFRGLINSIFDPDGIREEIKYLRSENRRLFSELALSDKLREENKALRKALELDIVEDEKFIFSEVIGLMFAPGRILIRQGDNMGLEKGFPVITPEGSLMGVISETYKNFSEVILVTSEDSTFEAKISGEEDTLGILRGSGDGLFMEMIPRDAKIKRGDMVVTFSQGGAFPGDIFIGQILQTSESDVEAFIQAEVQPSFHLNDLRFLFIIKK